MKNRLLITLIFVVALILILVIPNAIQNESLEKEINNSSLDKNYDGNDFEEIYLSGGCFWGVEEYMERVRGVIDATSGYANGNAENPSYEDVLYKDAGHAETVHVMYDPDVIDLEGILMYYFKVIDPTSINKQGNDRGSQYRTGIYYVSEDQIETIEKVMQSEQEKYEKEIVVEVEPLDDYYLAEEYHQDYLKKNPNGYCHIDLDIAKEDLERDDLSIKTDLVDESQYSKLSDEEIQEKLTKSQYNITQKNDTEMAYTHEYNDLDEKGIYVDIVTGEPLFSSDDKYDAGCGWPSFTKPIDSDVIKNKEDNSMGMNRIEIKSRVGDSHLGHLFDDGPEEEGGMRYCVNGGSLRFVSYDEMEEEGYGYLMDIFE